jgi:hypothetical protein
MKTRVMLGLLGALVLVPLAMVANAESVTITGGPDPSLHNYSWTVTNHHTARITYIEFPQYRVDLFHTPANWKQQIENVYHYDWKDRPGTCVAEPAPPYEGLPTGASVEFGMRVGRAGALPGKGTVRVKFNDGTEAMISDVELPTKPEGGSAYLALIGTGAIFVLFILYNERRRRRRPAVVEEEDEG